MRVCLIALIVLFALPFDVSGQSQPAPLVPAGVDLFDLAHVRLLDGPFKRHQELCRQYLLKLEPERAGSIFW